MPSRVPQERCGTQRVNATEGGVERSDRQDREISRRGRLACRAEYPRSAVGLRGRMPWKAVWSEATGKTGRFSARPACVPSRVPQERYCNSTENAMEGGVDSKRQARREISRRGRLACRAESPRSAMRFNGECHGRRCRLEAAGKAGDFSARPACVPSREPQERYAIQRENAMEGGVERSDRIIRYFRNAFA